MSDGGSSEERMEAQDIKEECKSVVKSGEGFDADEEIMSQDEESEEDDWIEQEDDDEDSQVEEKSMVYLPGSKLNEEERENKLVCDESAYVMLHKAHTGAPCLSFDILQDNLGDQRTAFPLTSYVVCGTQAKSVHLNSVIVMKMSNMHKCLEENKVAGDSEDDSEDEHEPDPTKAPFLTAAQIKHPLGAVNRIRATKLGNTQVAASWCERGAVYMWDLTEPLLAVNDAQEMTSYTKNHKNASIKPLFSFIGHGVEGFSMDWSPIIQGQFISGDCKKNIHLWKLLPGGEWAVDQRPFVGHTSSVEDLQWSPNEETVFASCSVDKSIRIWDIRSVPAKACMITVPEAHERDINVISWNSSEPFIVSGGDDGILKVWDLRKLKSCEPVALFKHHTSAITSVEWHHTDSSVFAASGSDDQISLWDLAVERDEDSGVEEIDVPPQLLFIHQGQRDIKEIHWHRQCPGVMISTAHTGFNIFKTISV